VISKGFHLGNMEIRKKFKILLKAADDKHINTCNCHLHTSRLSVGVVHMNVMGPMCVVAHDCALLASVLMGFLHVVCVPVCPEDPVFKQRNGKYMGKCTGNSPVPVLAVHVCKATKISKVYIKVDISQVQQLDYK